MRTRRSLRQYFLGTVEDGHESNYLVTTELLILSFATGIQDAASYPDYHCFASNQTGNTVLLAVAAAGLGGGDFFSTSNICTSLGVFLASCFITGQVGNWVGPRRRWWLVLSNLLSTGLMFAAAAVQYAKDTHVAATGPVALVVVTLLAFSSGSQVAMARPLNVPQITTAMATAAWVDLLVDMNFTKLKNYQRDRRFLFLALLTVGSFVGAFVKAKVNSPLALLLCAVCKLVVTGLFMLNKSTITELDQ